MATARADRRAGVPLIESMRPEDAEPVPELHEVDVRTSSEQIEAAMAKYPEVRSASLPALWAVQRHYGWCTPEGIRQAAAVMGVTPAYLESVATFYDLFRTSPVGRHHVLVCHNISLLAPRVGGRPRRASARPPASTPTRPTTSAPAPPTARCTSRGSSASAPATSRRWRRSTSATTGRSTPEDARTAVDQLRAGADPLPDKALAKRPRGRPEPEPDPRVKQSEADLAPPSEGEEAAG